MKLIGAILCGFVLDLLFGDPAWLPHPVVLMGKAISGLERLLRRMVPDTPKGLRLAGGILALTLPLGTAVVTFGVWMLAEQIHPAAGFAVQTLWCAQALAVKGLASESSQVQRALEQDDISGARLAVGRIVGRDVQSLTAEGVAKAAVETVAENFSDGVVAPLFYMFLGGAPLALVYKSINTMDSMVGYQNDRYLWFGRCAAKLDDGANYLPARIAALVWIAAAARTGQDAQGAYRIWRRDCRNHASPNSAQTESACAGALGVQLAGPAWYFGKRYEKPTIGDPLRPVEAEDIHRANRMLYAGSVLAVLIGIALRVLALWLGGVLC